MKSPAAPRPALSEPIHRSSTATRGGLIGGVVVALAFLLGVSAPGAAAPPGLIIDTGVQAPPGGALLLTSQQPAARFTLTERVEIGAIEIYMDITTGGAAAYRILPDDSAESTPSPHVGSFETGHLHEQSFVAEAGEGWQYLDGLSWVLEPGTYWIAVRADGDGFLGSLHPPEAGRNLDAHSWFVESNGDWHSVPNDDLMAVRIYTSPKLFEDGFESGDTTEWQ